MNNWKPVYLTDEERLAVARVQRENLDAEIERLEKRVEEAR